MRYADPLEDFNRYDREQEEKEHICYYCEKILKKERVLRIYDNLVCMECADEMYGEEID